MIQIIKADGAAELALIDNLRTRAAEIGEEINRTAAQMMADVKARGWAVQISKCSGAIRSASSAQRSKVSQTMAAPKLAKDCSMISLRSR